MDRIDRQMHEDQVPSWPDKCRKCLESNDCDPSMSLFCPPDKDCPYYPFGRDNDRRRKVR